MDDYYYMTCFRCRNVDQRYWLCNQHVEVRSAQWHPDSDTDSLLLVLASNNTFRLYDTLEGEPALLSVWVVGRQPVSSLPFLAGLGDTAVDFTFTPPQVSMTACLKLSAWRKIANPPIQSPFKHKL